MKILKFGGTSVGSVEAMLRVKDIVAAQNEPIVIVVSAMGGVTNKLIKATKLALMPSLSHKSEFESIVNMHHDALRQLFPNDKEIFERVDNYLNELGELLDGIAILKETTDRTMDRIVAYGELISSQMLANLLGARWLDSRALFKTHKNKGRNVVNIESTYQILANTIKKTDKVSVIAGFIASNESGDTTTLGRGGSDYTAALVAVALNASMLEIWTDVNGFMTADPRIINNAFTIPLLTYAEAMELAHFGAKVIYPPTIMPVLECEIPINIKNTFEPENAGSLIIKDVVNNPEYPVKGVTSIDDSCMITIYGTGLLSGNEVILRLISQLHKQSITTYMLSQASSESTVSVAISSQDAMLAESLLMKEFDAELRFKEISTIAFDKDVAVVAIVGEQMKNYPGISGKLFRALGKNGVNAKAIAQDASEHSVSWVIHKDELKKAISVVHEAFFLSQFTELNVFLLGIGTVGKQLLTQISGQKEKLLKDKNLKLRLVGIANSKKMLLDADGIAPSGAVDKLLSSDLTSDISLFAKKAIELNLFNSVFVDCTALNDVADLYYKLIDSNISVVAANKFVASSSQDNFNRIMRRATQRGVKFLFETNVGAGLPIITTLNDLINSGDKIVKIEAALSGTLNFIFNAISSDVPLSKAVRLSMEKGFAEPDPRIDLSGSDVIKKLVILARVAGYEIEMREVDAQRFIPQELFDGSLEDFWIRLEEYDLIFEEQRSAVESRGKRWRYVAKFEGSKRVVELVEVDESHPFFDIADSNNLILFTTERYNVLPLQIKGYGAGDSVTAAGVFADIMRVSNI
ncbi:MAG: bifunctional aspartate kinase/homoserine dehydrogenase I [Bacteroidales bacterium]